MGAKLVATDGSQEYPLLDFNLIGRSDDATLKFADSQLSRKHLIIRREDTKVWLLDLGSANGTRVNDVVVTTERLLHDGDRLAFGDQSLFYRCDDEASAEEEWGSETTRLTLPARVTKRPQAPDPVAAARPQVFICAASEDYGYARGLFKMLTEKGIQTFFSDQTLTEANFGRAIQDALKHADNLIVVTSSMSNAQKPWVENEWMAFLNEVNSGRKQGALLTVWCGPDAPDVPMFLGSRQIIPIMEVAQVIRFLKL